MSQPWMKFYPSDWRADPALRMCSLGARGLWMEMLCLMHEAEGSLMVNGKQLLPRQLAALTGASVDDVNAWLLELSDAGVFSRDEDGAIYSRRMRKDITKAAEDKANGRKGGNPRLKEGVNPPDNPPVGGGDKAQKPEARSQIPEAEKKEGERAPDGAPPAPISGEIIPLHPKAKDPPSAKATRMPSGFVLSPELLAFALKEGLTDAQARREFDKFADYHGSKGSRFVDWGRAWQTWVRKAVDGFGGSVRTASGGNGSQAPSMLRAYQRAAARFSDPDAFPE